MQIDPNFMNQQLEKEGRYQRKTGPVEPELNLDWGEVDEETAQFAQMAAAPEAPPVPQQRYAARPAPQIAHTQEEEILPGLYQSHIDSWKKQFGDVYYAEIKDTPFIFRALDRFEYKQIINTPNTDPLMREEMMCEICVLYPSGYDFATMTSQKAGFPAVLSELIMDHSGFTREVKVSKL